jgi:hypothetical protein
MPSVQTQPGGGKVTPYLYPCPNGKQLSDTTVCEDTDGGNRETSYLFPCPHGKQLSDNTVCADTAGGSNYQTTPSVKTQTEVIGKPHTPFRVRTESNYPTIPSVKAQPGGVVDYRL